ncbi:MAG TPA: ABC transporter ATP-binding protein [Candidatus Coproplasma stercorigallinarum]|nr:ABC transporter ATP-binding protein [Candidatus Coproplasma stercorigallinarum]
MRPLNQKQTVKRIFRQLKGYIPLIILSLLMAVITVAGNIIVPIFFGEAINLIAEGGSDIAGILRYFAVTGALIAVTCLSQWLMNVINNKITFSVTEDIRKEAFEHIQRLPLRYLDAHPYGDIVSRNIADVDQFADGLLMGFTQFFTGVLTIISVLVMMFVLNWIIALAVFVLTPLSLFIAKFISTRTYRLFRTNSQIRGEQTAFIDEMVGNLKVVQAFSHEGKNSEKFDEINERLSKASLDATFFSSLPNPTTRFVNSLVYAAVALAGALTIIYPSVLPVAFNVGKLTTLLSYANQYTKPFNEITGVITELQNAIACAGRIYELIDEPAQIPDKEDAAVLESAKGEVDFKDVCFSYSEERKLIENLNIAVKAGQRIAIVGPTGCGKTTLINLLMRFYDVDGGSISVDGTDIRDITRHSLRRNYGMVLQDTWLKSGTIKQNIAMGKPDATDEEIIEAAKNAHSHKFIIQLENGYDTVISEDGGNLSQGQKQLLCITRIMLTLPPMLILDEATSSIDTRTEMQIQEAFTQMMQGRTCFIVAHRLSTVKNADLILVMRDGKIIEQGKHEELIALGGFYNKLYNSQFAI